MSDDVKRLGFLAMMNPNAANQPVPDFIKRTIDPTFASKEQQNMGPNLEMNDNAQLDKPIINRRKNKRKAKPGTF